jgi:hypothetical protein
MIQIKTIFILFQTLEEYEIYHKNSIKLPAVQKECWQVRF